MKTFTKTSIAHKILSAVLNILLIFYSVAPGISASLVYAQEASPTPSPTEQPTATPTPQPTSEPTITPEPSPTATPTVEPTPSPTTSVLPEASPTLTPSPSPSTESLPTDQVESSSIPEPTVGQPNAPPAESPAPSVESSAEISPSPSVEPVQPVKGHLSATILENTDAQSLQLDLSTQGGVSSASLTTDKPDYTPTEVVIISGTDFAPNTTYTLKITSSDPPAVDFQAEVTANDKGTFIYSYQLDGNYRPNYKVEAKDSVGNVVATVTFTDAPVPSSVNLLDWETITSGAWINGNLGSSNSNYAEGETVPFELDLGKLNTSGNPYTFSVCRDYQNGSVRGYISLQPFNTSRSAVPDGTINTTSGPFSGSNISSISFTEVGGQGGCNSGQRETQVSFAVTSSSVNTYLLWGGKLASPFDAGAGNGAASYPGASLSMQLLSPAKNASINPNAIIELAQITVTKIVDSGSATPDQWGFNISPNPNGETLPKYPASGQSAVTFLGLPTGSYQITETSLSGYSFASGSGTNCTFSGSTGTASVTAATTAVSASCTFHNALSQGTLRVIKSVTNNSGGTAVPANFNLHVKSGGIDVSGSPAAGSSTGTVYTLPVGTYVVSEDTPPAGYTQTSFSGDCDSQGSVTVAAGVEKTCTITNDDQAGTLIVKKVVINNNGGTLDPEDFSFSVNGGNTTPFEADGQNDLTVNAGTYNITEPAVTGYDTTYDNCSNVQIPNGGSATCTITNNDIQPKLTVTKIVINDHGGTKQVSDFPLFVDQTPVTSGQQNGFNAGTYTVSETQDLGYDATISVDCAANGSITLNVGDAKSCTITNNDKAAHLIVIKHVVNDNGGSALASAFTMTINGVTASGGNSFVGAESPGVDKTLTTVGSYNVTETGPTGYASSSSFDCSGTIALGETKTCTITNDDNAPSLTLLKTVTNDNGGTVLNTAWTLSATGTLGSPTNFSGNTPVTSGTNFKADTYTLAENGGPPGYSASQYSCVKNKGAPVVGNSITLGLGDSVTCTINNDDVAPTLKLVKVVTNNDGGSAVAGDWTLTAAGDSGFSDAGNSTTFHTVKAGVNYTLSESSIPGYSAGDWSCNGGTQSTNHIQLAVGQTNVTCTITNNDQSGRIKIIKNTVGGNDTFGFTIDGPTPSTPDVTTANGTGDTGLLPVNAGSYSVSETTLPDGWDLTGANCDSGTPDSFTVPNGGTVICTFTNTKRGHLVVQKTTNPGGDQTVFTINATGNGIITGGGAGTVTDLTDKDYEVTPGTYSVAETVPAGWDKTGDTCQSVVVAAGENKTCLLTNTKRGHIIVEKNAIPDGSQVFTFNNNFGNGNPTTFNLTDTSAVGLPSFDAEVLPGTYTVSEYSVTGWQSSESATCSDGSSVNAIDVSPGETVTCTFVNEKLAKIILVKNTVGGSDSFDFDTTGTGLPTDIDLTTVAGTASQTFDDLDPDNTYTIAENVSAGWALTSSSCDNGDPVTSITPNAGEIITCTFTNSKPAAQIDLTPLTDSNKIGDNHVISANVQVQNGNGSWGPAADGTVVTFSITNSNGATAAFVPASPNTCTTTAGVCLITINSPTAGHVVVNASAGPVILGVTVNVATGTGGDNSTDAVKDYVNAKISITPSADTNEVNDDHSFTVTVEQNTGSGFVPVPAGTLANAIVSPSTSLDVSDCNDGVNASGQCTVIVNSSVAGVFTIIARSTVVVNGVEFKLQTNGSGSNSGPAVKTYVDASIALTPQTATNDVNDPHTITAHVTRNNGSGVTNAEGVTVVFTPTSGVATFVGSVNNCVTAANGECSVDINSTAPGTNVIDATTTFSVGEISLTRQTSGGDAGPNGTDSAEKTYIGGKIIVQKVTIGGDDSFNFNADYRADFALSNGGSNDSGYIPTGTHGVSEDVLTGWDLTGAICTGDDDGNNPASIQLDNGETVTCTFTNTKKGHLTVQKVTIPGGEPDLFTIQATGSGTINGSTSPYISDGLDIVSTYTVTPGTYYVTETVPIGWEETNNSCQGRVIVAGKDETCTITNTKLGTIIVEKQTNPDGAPGSFTFTGGASSTISDNGQITVGSLLPGIYTVSEDDPTPSFDLSSINCDDGQSASVSTADVPTRTATFRLDPGETIKCTFTNTQRGTISGTKYEVNADGSFVGVLSNWLIYLFSGDNPIGSTNTDPIGNFFFGNLIPGTYFLLEDLVGGWTPIFAPSQITLNPGDPSIDNNFGNFQNGSIQGVKFNDLNGDGQQCVYDEEEEDDICEPTLSEWVIFLDENEDGILDDEEQSQETDEDGYYSFTDLGPGSYTVCEKEQTGWQRTRPIESNCETVSITQSNQTSTVDFGNQGRGTITVRKNVDTDGDEQVDETNVTDWTWDIADGQQDISTGDNSQGVSAGTYTISEDQKDNYHVTAVECNNDGEYGLSGSIRVEVEPGQDLVCTFTNTRDIGNLRVNKVVDSDGDGKYDATNPENFKWGTSSEVTSYNMGQSQTLITGNYNVYENSVAGYAFVGWFPGNPVENQYNCNNLPEGDIYTKLPVAVTIASNEPVEITLCNQLLNPILTISKSNDKTGVDLSAGDSVLYTLVIEATQSGVRNVVVRDLLPDGFEYRAGSWTATSNVNPGLVVTEPVYASPGIWHLGDMAKDEKITLTLIADISDSQDSGLYKDLAWAQGQFLASTQVLANAEDPGFVDDNFVGTQVNIVKNPDGTAANIEKEQLVGEVLGASIALPATGANALWLVLAILLLAGGSGSIILGRNLRRKNV